ncbi:MAG: penicillin-binding transpeptidase domain-containing protein [Pseudomonadota bacterium]
MKRATGKKVVEVNVAAGRRWLVYIVMLAMGGLLIARAVDLHVRDRDFLRNQGEARQHRVVSIPAHRGMLLDRNGEPLAISTPVDTLWAEPERLAQSDQLGKLARVLDISTSGLKKKLEGTKSREFAYLRRHVDPELSKSAMALEIDGVHVQREYRRYYPFGEVTSHVLGFTNIDDQGQEGLELAYHEWLAGKPGARRVIRDRLGRAIADIESIRPARPGRNLTLSIDKRLQYVAYRELQNAVQTHKARSSSAVVLDVNTGEVLAMVNQPAYNPNRRTGRTGPQSRNRAVTDVLEPGSTMKPITLAAALESGEFDLASVIATEPGFYSVGSHEVKDHRNYGDLDLAGILQKSSNVGASKIALSLDPQQMWSVYDRFGFGQPTGSGFPGEATGTLNHASQWRKIEQATLSFGYGVSMTPLQLARAYAAIAAGGVLPEISFLKQDDVPPGRRVISREVALQLHELMETVLEPGGSGTRARVLGYRVAGKTGTSWKSRAGGYDEDRHMALFAGFAPASRPEVVVLIVVDEPSVGGFYGGVVAAPVFSKLMSSALRLRGTLPDDWQPDNGLQQAQAVPDGQGDV